MASEWSHVRILVWSFGFIRNVNSHVRIKRKTMSALVMNQLTIPC